MWSRSRMTAACVFAVVCAAVWCGAHAEDAVMTLKADGGSSRLLLNDDPALSRPAYSIERTPVSADGRAAELSVRAGGVPRITVPGDASQAVTVGGDLAVEGSVGDTASGHTIASLLALVEELQAINDKLVAAARANAVHSAVYTGSFDISMLGSLAGRFSCASGSDLDGDGVGDLLLSTDTRFPVALLLAPDGSIRTAVDLTTTLDGSRVPLVTNAMYGMDMSMVGDVNGDGVPDVVVTERSTTGKLHLLLMTAAGDSVAVATSVHLGSLHVSSRTMVLAVGDADGDGVPDVGYSDETAIHILLLASDGSVKSTHVLADIQAEENGLCRVLGDLDGNGRNDAVCLIAPAEPFAAVLFIDMDGTLLKRVIIDIGDHGYRYEQMFVAPGDVDGNGVPDLFVSVAGGSPVGVLFLLESDGSVRRKTIMERPADMTQEEAAIGCIVQVPDTTGDGRPELAFADSSWTTMARLQFTPDWDV